MVSLEFLGKLVLGLDVTKPAIRNSDYMVTQHRPRV